MRIGSPGGEDSLGLDEEPSSKVDLFSITPHREISGGGKWGSFDGGTTKSGEYFSEGGLHPERDGG